MHKMKIKVLIFARSFLANYASEIDSDIFDTIFVVLTKKEKELIEAKGKKVYGCFEEEFSNIKESKINGDYLKTSFSSDRFLCRFDLKKRLEILGKEITFWRSIIEKTKPNYLVNESISIEISEVMAIEAERYGIPFLSDLQGFFPYTFYWKPSPFDGRLNDLSTIKPNDANLLKAKGYYNDVVEKGYKPFYIIDSLKPYGYSLKNIIASLYRDTILYIKKKKLQRITTFRYEDDYSFFSYQMSRRLFNRIIYSYDNIKDLKNKQIIFFPLHIEPEAILNYFAEEYQNQVSTIENIAKTLKPNQYLVIKEHPQQKGALLDRRYRDLKKKLLNLIYLPAELNCQDIIIKSEAIVTLTSTAAWEGVLFGKPVFVLGKIFYDQCPGVTKIESIKHLKEEIRKDEYLYPQKEDVLNFIAAMISIFNKGCATPYAKESFKQNVMDYTIAIEKAIQKK